MLIKTILNYVEKHKSFIYGKTYFEGGPEGNVLIVELRHRRNSKGQCPLCQKNCPGYDKLSVRDYQFVPLWGMPSYFRYKPRRVACKEHGIHVELLPFAAGKQTLTKTYQSFLATWAKRLSWKETAEVFKTSWESVYRSVKYVVEYGLAHRNWDGIKQAGCR
jgi:transposase